MERDEPKGETRERQADIPFVPLDTGSADEAVELLGEGSAGNGDSEPALLLYCLTLGFDDEAGERFDEL